MRFSLLPREEKFFDLFDEVGAIISRASGKFLDMVMAFDRLKARAQELKLEERACDEVVERIVKALDRSFITPFDREDIHSLASKLDDVLDNMEETAHRLDIFRMAKLTPQAVSLAEIIQQACLHLEHAVRACRTLKRPKVIQDHLKEITRLEKEADTIYREADGVLFADPPDILTLIKLREIYGWLEETVDACQDAGQVISEIVIKGT
jgi:predicted phosphate transport protein (TIGR00153 family)